MLEHVRRGAQWGIMQKPRLGQWASCTIGGGYSLAYAQERVAWLNKNSTDGSEFAVFDRSGPS